VENTTLILYGFKFVFISFQILRINTKYNILYVVGGNIPGPTHGYVKILDTYLNYRKMPLLKNPPQMPTWFSEDAQEPLPEELFDESLFQFTDDSLQLQEESN
jgi:large subunit ribosomal protein L3